MHSKRLRKTDLKLKESKCNFLKAHVQYLGHLILGQEIIPLLAKLIRVQEMSPPKNPKEVRQFLELVGYYHKFMPCLADLFRPLTSLTEKGISFDWT